MRPRQAILFGLVLLVTMACLFTVALPGPMNTPFKTACLTFGLLVGMPATFAIAFVPLIVRGIRSALVRRNGVQLHGVVVSSAPTRMTVNYTPEYRATIRHDDGSTSTATLLLRGGIPPGTDVMVKADPRDRRFSVIDAVRFDGAPNYTKI